jgi:hypothetical protein
MYIHFIKSGISFQVAMGQNFWDGAVNGGIPLDAWVAGQDKGPIYVGRTFIDGDLTPGKVVPSTGHAYFPYHGTERIIDGYAVLRAVKGTTFAWIPWPLDRPLHPAAFQAGWAKNLEPYYVCRVQKDGADVIGKVSLFPTRLQSIIKNSL